MSDAIMSFVRFSAPGDFSASAVPVVFFPLFAGIRPSYLAKVLT